MTPEEIAANDAAVPLATDEEIADVFCTYSGWSFEPAYYDIAKVALVAAAARGLSLARLREISRERIAREDAVRQRALDEIVRRRDVGRPTGPKKEAF